MLSAVISDWRKLWNNEFENVGKELMVKGDSLNAMKVISGNKKIPFKTFTKDSRLILEVERTLIDDIRILFAQDKWYVI